MTPNYIDPDEHLITYFREKLEVEKKADIFRNAGKKLPPEIDSQYYEQKMEDYNEELNRKRPRRTFRIKSEKEWIEQQSTQSR